MAIPEQNLDPVPAAPPKRKHRSTGRLLPQNILGSAPPISQFPSSYPSRHRPERREHRCPGQSCCFHRTDQGCQRGRVHRAVKTQAAPTIQAQFNPNRWGRLSGRRRHRHSGRNRNIQRAASGDHKPFFVSSCRHLKICCRVTSWRCATCVTVAPPIPTDMTISSLSSPRQKCRRSTPKISPRIAHPA